MLRIVGKICADFKISLISIRASGFIGSVRVYGAEHESIFFFIFEIILK